MSGYQDLAKLWQSYRLGISTYIARKFALPLSRANSMIALMIRSVAQIKVWIDCPTCGRLEKLVRDVRLPLELVTPMLEKTCAACERCRGIAVMCFERGIRRVH